MIRIKNLTCGYGNKKTVTNINMDFDKGEVVCLLGPNGVGKTTFFKSLLGFIKAIEGEIYINDKSLEKFSKKERAKAIAYVPQAHHTPFDFKVQDVIMMGRTIHFKKQYPEEQDKEVVNHIMEELGLNMLKDKSYLQISGGEQQLVLIARALAQETDTIVLDEPTSNLDFGNQWKIMKVIKKLKEQNKLIIMTTHSPNQVFECGTKVVAFKSGQVYAIGNPEDVINDTFLFDVYNVKGRVYDLDGNHNKVCVSY
jgi:ABC-type cobalamin/Fe3+-siderophores transport systems, ATPase components